MQLNNPNSAQKGPQPQRIYLASDANNSPTKKPAIKCEGKGLSLILVCTVQQNELSMG